MKTKPTWKSRSRKNNKLCIENNAGVVHKYRNSLLLVILLGLLPLTLTVACGGTGNDVLPGDGSDGGVPDGDGGIAADEESEFGQGVYSLVSADGQSHGPAPVCAAGHWIDFNCDALLPMDCASDGKHIDFDPADDVHCPVCVEPSQSDPDDCAAWQTYYGIFLYEFISDSCANWCEETRDCFAWEIHNACGIVAWSLRGLVDEEPILFAETFAKENCKLCSSIGQVLFLRRPGSDEIEPIDGATGHGSGLLEEYRPECHKNQCVLVQEQ